MSESLRRCKGPCGLVKSIDDFQPSNLPALKAKGVRLHTCKSCWKENAAIASGLARAGKAELTRQLETLNERGHIIVRSAPQDVQPGDGIVIGNEIYQLVTVWTEKEDTIRVRVQDTEGKLLLRTLRKNRQYDRVLPLSSVPVPPPIAPPFMPTSVAGLSLAGLRNEAQRIAIDTILTRHKDEHDAVFNETYRDLLTKRLPVTTAS